MQTIWKFAAPVDDEITVKMPAGARVLSVAVQHDSVCLWALVDSNAHIEERRFFWLGTGHPVGHRNLGRFVGTILAHGGSLVFHLFEEFTATLANA